MAEVFGPDPDYLLFEEAEIFGPRTRKESHRYGPTGGRDRRGGYLEYNRVNLQEFTRYFNPLMPSWLYPADLLILSTDFQNSRRWHKYKILPPRSLWPKMAGTLSVLNKVRLATGARFTIKSAYRSYFINSRSGGAPGSRHLEFSALDLEPAEDDRDKVRAYLEHLWWEKGDDLKLGLGYYSLKRVHIDAYVRRHRARGWKGTDAKAEPSRAQAKKNYEREFSTPLSW